MFNSRNTWISPRGRGVIALCIVALVGVGLWGAMAFRSTPTSNAGSHSSASVRVFHIDGRLAHVYNSIGELKAASDAIIVATITSQSSEMLDDQMYTLSTVDIDRVLWSKDKGQLEDTAIVWQVGGTSADGSVRYEMDDYPVFTPGARYVLFLTTPTPKPSGYWTTGAFEGAFSLDASERVSSYSPLSAQIGINVRGVPLSDFAAQVQTA